MLKNFVLITIVLALGVGCTATTAPNAEQTSMSPNKATLVPAPERGPLETPSVQSPQPDAATALDGASDETYLGSLCEKKDFEAVRVYQNLSDRAARTAEHRLCEGEAFLAIDRLDVARDILTPLLRGTDKFAQKARSLLSLYYERLGRFDSIVDLYASVSSAVDSEVMRNLGVAYLRLGAFDSADNLLPKALPQQGDAWRWIWWLRAFESEPNPTLNVVELEALLAALSDAPATYEVAQLRPLLTQAYRRGQWLSAAQRCTEASEGLDNENRALKMARTSVAAAVRGDRGVWEAALSCALKLALLTESPEETCQEIHREQIDWSVDDKLVPDNVVYPDSRQCGWEDAAIRDWIKRWRSGADTERSS